MIIRVPKKNEYAFKAPEAKQPERIKMEHPHFPKNLPHSEAQKNREANPPPPKKYGRDPGSGTLG